MAKKRQQKASEFHLTKVELQKVIHAPDVFRDRCILKTFMHTGIRRFELANLDIRDVDFERRRIHIREGKGGKERTVFGTADLFSDLKHHIGRRKKGPLFLSNRGTALNLAQINRIVAAAGARAGVKNPDPQLKHINPHLLRHTFAWLYKQTPNWSLQALQNQLGHASIQTTLDEYGTESIDESQEHYDHAVDGMF